MADIKVIGAVAVKVRPDAKGFREKARADILNELQNLKPTVHVEADIDLDDKDLERKVDKVKKKTEKKMQLSWQSDYDSIDKAFQQVQKKIQELNAVKLDVELNKEGLAQAEARLAGLRKNAAVKMDIVEDEQGFKEALTRIRALQREKLLKTISFKTDDKSLEEAANTYENAIAEMTRTAGIQLEISPDVSGYKQALAAVDKELAKFESRKFHVELDEDALRAEREYLEKIISQEPLSMKVDWGSKSSLEAAKRELEQKLSDAKAVVLEVDPDETSIEQAIQQVNDAIAEMESEDVDLNVVPHTAAAAAQMTYTTRPRFADIFVRVNKRSLAIAEGVLQSLAGINTLRSVGNTLENLAVNFDTIAIKSTLLSSALAGVVNTLSYMATSMVAIGDDVFESVGLLATAPAALAALTATVVITTAAFQDFGAAVDGDAEALARLPENAREAARALQGTWDMIQKPVQEAFWEGMGDSLAEVVEVIMPQFRDGLTLSARHAGDFAEGVANAFKTIADNGDLEEMFRNLAAGFDTASDAAEPFFDALNTLGLRGSEYLPQFGQWLTDISEQFNEFIQLADANGDINRWIEQGIESLKNMWSVGGSVVDMFRALTKAANVAGMQGLDEFADNMRGIADMMLAEPFQSRMATIFEGANEGARELAEGIEVLGEAVGESADFVAELLTKLGSLSGNVLKGLAETISQIEFQEGVIESVEGMNAALNDLGPTFANIGQIIGDFGSLAGEVFRNLAPVINTVSEVLENALDSIGPALESLSGPLARMLNSLATALSGPLLGGIELLAGAIEGLAAAPPIIQDLAFALAGLTALRAGGFFKSFTTGLAGMAATLTGSTKSFSTWRTGIARQFVMTQRTLNSLQLGGFQRSMMSMGQIARRGTLGVTRALSGMTALLGGPWGLAIGAVAIGALSAFGQAQAETEQHIRSMTDALDTQTGAVTKDNVGLIADSLAKDSVHFLEWLSGAKEMGDYARILGTNLEELAGVIASDNGTYEDYIDILSKYPGAYGKTTMSMKEWADQMGISEEAAKSLGVAGIYTVIDNLKQERGALAESKEGWIERNGAAKEAGKTAASVAKQFENINAVDVSTLGGAMRDLADASGDAAGRVDALKKAIDILNGNVPTAEEALGNIEESMDNLGTVFKDTEGNFYDFSNAIGKDGKISQATEPMRGLYDAVNGLGDEMLIAAEGMDAAGVPAGEIAKKLQGMQDEFMQAGKKAGLSAGQVEKAFARYIGATPEEIAIMLDMDINPLQDKAEIADATLRKYNAAKAVAKLAGDDTQLGVELATAYDDLEQWDKAIGTATADLNPKKANAKREALERSLITLAMMDPTVKADMDPRLFERAEERVMRQIKNLDAQEPSPLVNALTAEARARLQAIRDMLNAVDGRNTSSKHTHTNLIRNITSHEAVGPGPNGQARPNSAGPQYNANGNLYDRHMRAMKFANGGITGPKLEKPGGAKIYSPKTQFRIFAEPETGGEAYIPMAAGKRSRSEKILGEVANKFGGQFVKHNTTSYASGGMTAASTPDLPIQLTINSVPTDNAQATADTIMSALRHAKRGGVYSGVTP